MADGCSQVNATTWKVCNNRCGYVTPAQAAAYNAGAAEVRERISALLHVNSSTPESFGGFLYVDGLSNTAKCPRGELMQTIRLAFARTLLA